MEVADKMYSYTEIAIVELCRYLAKNFFDSAFLPIP
jgi:hypothetical protein